MYLSGRFYRSFQRLPQRIFERCVRACVSVCTQKTPNLRCSFLKRRPTNTPRRHRLADGQLSSFYPPSPSFSSFGAASVMLCCSAPPLCSRTPLRPSVDYSSISRVENSTYVTTFCEHLTVLYIVDQPDLYRFEIRLELHGANARLFVCRPSLSPSHPSTPTSSRWLAFTTLHHLATFQLVQCRSCEALLPSSSLTGQKHPFLLHRLCLICRRYKGRFAMNMGY